MNMVRTKINQMSDFDLLNKLNIRMMNHTDVCIMQLLKDEKDLTKQCTLQEKPKCCETCISSYLNSHANNFNLNKIK